MRLDAMKPVPGSRKARKRVGRGPGSGTGKTAARGHKGQGARSGGQVTPGFEGGQMPISRRLPKHGFTNFTRVEYQIVNLSDLQRFEAGSVVDEVALRERRVVRRRLPIKVLGKGTIDRGLTVRAHAFSKSAEAAIRAAGGSVEVVALETAESSSGVGQD